MAANWTRYSGLQSALAPMSSTKHVPVDGGEHRADGRALDARDPAQPEEGRRP